MICACSKCGAKLNIPDAKIPDKGARVRCVKCKSVFTVKKKGSNAPVAAKKQDPGKEKTKTKKKKGGKTQIEEEPPPSAPKPPPSHPQSNEEKRDKKNGDEETAPEESKKSVAPIIKMGAPPWIMTFADLATLMLTFFVLLLSFANTDIAKFKEMLGSVQDAFGVSKKTKGQFQATLSGDTADIEGSKGKGEGSGEGKGEGGESITDSKAKQEMERQQVAREIENTASQIGESKNIAVSVRANGISVRIKGAYFFGPGTAILKRAALPFLDNIANTMKEFPFKLMVEGHTDDIPISTRQFPSNWELSAVRATTVLRYFVEEKGIDPKRLTAIGYAENKPIASNDDPSGRASNRRVEFIFSR